MIVVAGPTAIGKTSLAVTLARQLDAEIVSADSRQFYRELNAGTAKPTRAQLASVPHHLINSLSISEEYNAGKFEADALSCLEEIFQRKHTAILCGGSGLYIDLICEGSDPLPPQDKEIRKSLNDLYAVEGISALQQKLLALDPDYYHSVDLNNPHRLIRALEVCLTTGSPYSKLRKGKGVKRNFEIFRIGLEDDRQVVYGRIDKRVTEMMENGLLEEVRELYPYKDLNALKTVGYTELFQHLEGRLTLEEAVDKIRQHTRNYAKRQWTWFRKNKSYRWFHPSEERKINEAVTEWMNGIRGKRADS